MSGTKQNRWVVDFVLFILASPVLAVRYMIRFFCQLGVVNKSLRTTLPCRTCGAEISLVGLWKCGCGFTYQGNILRYCPICKLFPNMIRCYRCGTTEKIGI
jgi:hypothetical protein